MNILVTGAGGQLGKEIRKVVDRIGNGHADHNSSEKNYYIFAGHEDLDITNEDAVAKYVKEHFINVIVNCAAYTNVDKAQTDRDNAYDVNAKGPMNLAIAANLIGAVLIHISTDYVFGGKYDTPIPPMSQMDEGFIPVERDDCFYGFSKLVGEDLIEHSGCKYLIFRTSWLYSPEGKNFVKTMFNRGATNSMSKVVMDQVGSPTSATDLAEFIVRIIERNNAENRYLSKQGIYNFCNGGVASWYDVARAVYEINFRNENLVSPCTSEEFETPVKRPNYSVLDFRKTSETFDEEQKYWLDSLKEVTGVLNAELKKQNEALEVANSEWEYGHNVCIREKEEEI